MKKTYLFMAISIILLLLTACNKDQPAQATNQAQPAPTAANASAPTPSNQKGTAGTVVETMDAAGYTYVQVDDGNEKIWAAAPKFAVAVGDDVLVPEGMAMHNYHSQSLDRDFPVVYFVDSVLNTNNPAPTAAAVGGAQQMPEDHPPITGIETPDSVDFSDISKLEDGHQISEIYAEKANLAGQKISLRGKVVKFSPQIMGTNWIHIQDGSGDSASGNNDLTVTSPVEVKVGDTVVARGPLTVDKDFGYGYKYDLILEDAEVSVE